MGHRERASLAATHADEGGQTIVLVALLFVVLLAFAALSLDVGRFYAERRYLQNAVDSAALACARVYSQGGSVQTAWNAADNILQKFNLLGDPTGSAVTYPGAGDQIGGATAPLSYLNSIVTDQNLIGGIKPITSPVGCRVALTVNVQTYFIKLVQPTLSQIGMVTKAYAKSSGGFLPSVAAKYSSPPGPGDGSVNNFIAWTMQGPDPGDVTGTTGRDYLCTSTTTAGCTPATPANPGREHVLFGASASASNDSSFRGYIALDIRDFQTIDASGNPIHTAYNGVAPDADANTLKSFESQWIDKGYPGPDLCVVNSGNFLPCGEVAALDGSSSGIFVTEYNNFFNVGDIVMLQLYDGTVKSIPDFTIQGPTVTVPQNGAATSTGITYTMNTQFQASGSVIGTELYFDDGSLTGGPGDPSGTNPFMTGAITGCTDVAPPGHGKSCGTFISNPTPANVATYSQSWNGLTANNAQQGIYLVWLRGNATAPYDQRQHDTVATVIVKNQQKDFRLDSSVGFASVAAPGVQADYAIAVRDHSGATNWNGTNITLRWEQCPTFTDLISGITSTLSCKINGNAATTSVSVPIGSGSSVEATFNVDTTTALTDKVYSGWVRGFGTASGNPVNHVFPVQLAVNTTAGGVTNYIDVVGYAAFKVTAYDSNDVSGVAVSPAVLDPNDPLLAIAKKIRLVPWETP